MHLRPLALWQIREQRFQFPFDWNGTSRSKVQVHSSVVPLCHQFREFPSSFSDEGKRLKWTNRGSERAFCPLTVSNFGHFLKHPILIQWREVSLSFSACAMGICMPSFLGITLSDLFRTIAVARLGWDSWDMGSRPLRFRLTRQSYIPFRYQKKMSQSC